MLCCCVAHLKTLNCFKVNQWSFFIGLNCCCYSWSRWYNMGHNSGDSIGGNIGPSAGSGGINKRHRGSPRNAAKNSAGQLRSSNSAETQMHSKPRLVSWINFHLYFFCQFLLQLTFWPPCKQASFCFLEWGREKDAMPESHQTFEVGTAHTSAIVDLVRPCQVLALDVDCELIEYEHPLLINWWS